MKRLLFPLALAMVSLGFGACTDVVEGEQKIAATGVSMDLESDLLGIGQRVTLYAMVEPQNATDQNVVWNSADKNVATVEDGVVTAVGVGDTKITATTVDGGHVAECAIKVATEVVDVLSVALNATEHTIVAAVITGGEIDRVNVDNEFQMEATISPADATLKDVTWSISDQSIATISETGLVTGLHGGVVTVTATSVDGGVKASCEITVYVPLKAITATPSEIGPDKTVSIIPKQTVPVTLSYDPEDAFNKNFTLRTITVEGATGSLSYAVDPDNKDRILVTGGNPGKITLLVTPADRNPLMVNLLIEVTKVVTGISFSKENHTLWPESSAEEDKTIDLKPLMTITPADPYNDQMTWSSSDPAVATVDQNGKVTGLALGTAVITATSADGGTDEQGNPIKASITIYVKAPHPTFGIIEPRTDRTWEVVYQSVQEQPDLNGGPTQYVPYGDPKTYVWSDYLTAERCKTDTAQFAPTQTGGDCLKHPDGYYDLFSYNMVKENSSAMCAEGWRASDIGSFRDTDFGLYPVSATRPHIGYGAYPQYLGGQEWVDKWGLEYGGYWNGTAIVKNASVTTYINVGNVTVQTDLAYVWAGGTVAAPRTYVILYKEPQTNNSLTNNPNSVKSIATTSNWAMGFRCVRVKTN